MSTRSVSSLCDSLKHLIFIKLIHFFSESCYYLLLYSVSKANTFDTHIPLWNRCQHCVHWNSIRLFGRVQMLDASAKWQLRPTVSDHIRLVPRTPSNMYQKSHITKNTILLGFIVWTTARNARHGLKGNSFGGHFIAVRTFSYASTASEQCSAIVPLGRGADNGI